MFMFFRKKKENSQENCRKENCYKVVGVARDGRQIVTTVTAKDEDEARQIAMAQPMYVYSSKHGRNVVNFKGIDYVMMET